MGQHGHKQKNDAVSDDAKHQESESRPAEVSLQEYQQMKEELARQKDQYIRLCAEFENARKRQERDRTEFVKYANENLIRDFLNIVDDLERTVNVAKEKHQDYDSFLKGVEMVMKHVGNLLKQHGVDVIDPKGQPFDPYAHEILMQEPTDQYENGTVMEALQKGYKIDERVIRTAKVKVALAVADSNHNKTESPKTAEPESAE